MKNKLFRILAIAFVLSVAAIVFVACGSNEQSLDGMYIVTFEFNGGILDTNSSNVSERINHAYYPGSKVIDISQTYKFTRSGYVFDYWCTDENLTTKFDFKSNVTGDMTLYAKWKSAIVYSYTVYLVDGDELTVLGQYEVEAGANFNDTSHYGTMLSTHDKTFLGYYSDNKLTTEWNEKFTHPGGEQSCDIPVYVKAMDGVWTFVSTYEELNRATIAGNNIWLIADIDCNGNELYFGDSQSKYSGKLNGNNHTISNFKIVKNGGTSRRPEYTLFGSIQATASIVDIKFTGVRFVISEQAAREIKTASLGVSAEEGATISNVSIAGTYANTTSIAVSQETINRPFYEESTVAPVNFIANIIAQDN